MPARRQEVAERAADEAARATDRDFDLRPRRMAGVQLEVVLQPLVPKAEQSLELAFDHGLGEELDRGLQRRLPLDLVLDETASAGGRLESVCVPPDGKRPPHLLVPELLPLH